jgi:hypothetical protein
VGATQARRDPRRQVGGHGGLERGARQPLGERLAVGPGEDEQDAAVAALAGFIEGAETRVIEGGQRLGAAETAPALDVVEQVGRQPPEQDEPFEIAVARLESPADRARVEGFFRVDLGDCPPRPPTDPYVRDYRIRFLRPRFRYATSARPTDSRGG